MIPAPLRFIVAAEALCLGGAAICWILAWRCPDTRRLRRTALFTAGGFILKLVRVSLALVVGIAAG